MWTGLDAERAGSFHNTFLPFVEEFAKYGAQNTLMQTVLKLTLPGMPDVYQGTELWDFSLVDPDNRRPVDYEVRRRLLEKTDRELAEDRGGAMAHYMRSWQDGRFKLAAILSLLGLRRELPNLFSEGSYEPIAAQGERADDLCAFYRQHGEALMVVAIARFPRRRERQALDCRTVLPLPDPLQDCQLREVLTARPIPNSPQEGHCGALLLELPAAVLVGSKRQ